MTGKMKDLSRVYTGERMVIEISKTVIVADFMVVEKGPVNIDCGSTRGV